MKTLFKYDFTYLWKTSKFIIIIVLGIFLAMLSVLTAYFLNDILQSAFDMDEFCIPITEPTVYDAYGEFFNNFTQIYLMVVLFLSVAFFTRDTTKDHLPLIFSKPLSRKHYVLSKSIWYITLIFIGLAVSIAIFMTYSYLLFEVFHVGRFIVAMLGFYVFLLIIGHIALLFSMLFKSYLAPAALTFGVFILFTILNMFDQGILKYLPNQLLQYPNLLLLEQISYTTFLITTVIGTITIGLLLFGAVQLFKRKSLL